MNGERSSAELASGGTDSANKGTPRAAGVSVLGLIAANVRRRRARTFLTAAGIAVGVAAIVALLALSAGLNRTAGQLVHLGGADLGLFQRDAGDPTSSVLPLSMLKRLRAESQIADVRSPE